ncbi:nucleoside kinase [Bacillus haimaensis]|uniref:nucleoside kinase n=1 Tax=Bacillus haimaensis TaxID=3160967 RepID=UPI003AA93AA4
MSKVPLYIVTGAGGAGKTYVIHSLRKIMPEYDILDYDGIFQFLKDDAGKVDKHQIQNIWLRVAQDIAESGRITILCGLIKPEDIAACKYVNYFSRVDYLILHCDDITREKRLYERKKMTSNKVKYIKKLAKWFIEISAQYDPPIPIIDTSEIGVTEVAEQIRDWIYEQNRRNV